MKKIFSLFIVILLVGVSGCYEEEKETPTKGNLVLAIDESVAPTMRLVVKDFERLYIEAKINMKIESAREGIADLLNEHLTCVISSRDFNKEEKEVIAKFNLNIQTYKIADDGIAIIVNKQNLISQLDLLQIKKIFSGEAKDWKTINKSYSGPIRIFGENQNSGCYEYLKDKVMAGINFSNSIYPCTSSTHILNMVSKAPNSIGWVGLSYKPKDNKEIKVVEVAAYDSNSIVQNYFEPYPAHIYRKYYPLSRPIFIFSRDAGMGLGSGFVAFITHSEGQKIINESGLVPATQTVRLIQYSK
jgi:phosphate transport system substrate-binding protein